MDDIKNLFTPDIEAERLDSITQKVIGGAIAVHRALGPGLLESAYEECLCFELKEAGLSFERQVPLKLIPVHEAQLLSYLKLGNKPVGLLLNFHTPILKSGLKRIVNKF